MYGMVQGILDLTFILVKDSFGGFIVENRKTHKHDKRGLDFESAKMVKALKVFMAACVQYVQ